MDINCSCNCEIYNKYWCTIISVENVLQNYDYNWYWPYADKMFTSKTGSPYHWINCHDDTQLCCREMLSWMIWLIFSKTLFTTHPPDHVWAVPCRIMFLTTSLNAWLGNITCSSLIKPFLGRPYVWIILNIKINVFRKALSPS